VNRKRSDGTPGSPQIEFSIWPDRAAFGQNRCRCVRSSSMPRKRESLLYARRRPFIVVRPWHGSSGDGRMRSNASISARDTF
jgi:hypothetical protein